MKTPRSLFCLRRLPGAGNSRASIRGISFVETLMSIAALSVLGGISYVAFTDVGEGVRGTKMQSDVSQLNEAVRIYVASGGDLSKAKSPDAVLANLKTRLSSEDAAARLGIGSGSMVDHRLVTELQTVREAATNQARVQWNTATEAFEIKYQGAIGVKRFHLDYSLKEVVQETETRDSVTGGPAMWDYQGYWVSVGGDDRTAPTLIAVDAFPDSPSPVTDPVDPNEVVDPVDPDNPGTGTTDPSTGEPNGPGTGTGGGGVDPEVDPSNPTDPGSGVDGGDPDGSLNPGTGIGIDTGNGSTDGLNNGTDAANPDGSGETGGESAEPERLPTPVVDRPGGAYAVGDFPLTVHIVDADSYDPIGRIRYQIDSGEWRDYEQGIEIRVGRSLVVEVAPTNPQTHLSSFATSDYYFAVPHLLTGVTGGALIDVGGGPNLAYELSESDTLLTHGSPFTTEANSDVVVESGEANTLQFIVSPFSGVVPGTPFKIGELLYYNGTTFDASHATSATLKIDVIFTDPMAAMLIEVPLHLVNTANVSASADASADIVRLAMPNRVYSTENIDGRSYELTVEFGEPDANGFTDGNGFHVYEGSASRVPVMATMIDKGAAGGGDPTGHLDAEAITNWLQARGLQ